MAGTIRYVVQAGPVLIRYVLLESHSPQKDVPVDDKNRKRIELYRSLGAYWIRGIDYAIPSHTDPEQSIRYEILFFAVSNDFDNESVKQAIRYLADDAYKTGDPRSEKFEESLKGMYIQAPPDNRLI